MATLLSYPDLFAVIMRKIDRYRANTNPGVIAHAQHASLGVTGPNLPFMASVENDRSQPLPDIGQVALIILLFLEAGIAALTEVNAKTFRRMSLEI